MSTRPPARARRRRARRALYLRRRLLAVAVIAAVVAIASLALGGGPSRAPARIARHRPAQTPAVHPSATHRALARQRSPGSLPQTHAYPSATSAQFHSLMAALWTGIVRGSLAPAATAFFPEGAYLQLKAIAGAGSDWSARLLHDYSLDIGAAHALLGSAAARASLVTVAVDSSYGHWIPPGVCDNRLGYYEMPNARMVYSEGGQIRSFGIASMISWRGVWYVVHLGAILRASDAGAVDAPAIGPGIQAYSATC